MDQYGYPRADKQCTDDSYEHSEPQIVGESEVVPIQQVEVSSALLPPSFGVPLICALLKGEMHDLDNVSRINNPQQSPSDADAPHDRLRRHPANYVPVRREKATLYLPRLIRLAVRPNLLA